MDSNRLGRLLCLAAVTVLGGCEGYYRHEYPMDPAFGNATRRNAAAHTVDPDPAPAKDTDLLFDGQRIKKAMDRYRGGEEKKPEAVTTK